MSFKVSPDYTKTAVPLEWVLKLVARTKTGRAVLEEFLPLYSRKWVIFEGYPSTLVKRLREEIPGDHPIGAAFVADEVSGGRIFYDPNAPLGILAAFFVHEMVHAIDADRGFRAKRDWSKLTAESRAFEAQFQFTSELRELDPKYDEFIRAQTPAAQKLFEQFNEQMILELYGT